MKEIEELLKQIIKTSKDKQAQYWYGVEFCGHNKPDYRARILFSKRMESALFASTSLPKLKEKVKLFIDNGNVKDSVVSYAEEQIKTLKSEILFHENLIKDYDKNTST